MSNDIELAISMSEGYLEEALEDWKLLREGEVSLKAKFNLLESMKETGIDQRMAMEIMEMLGTPRKEANEIIVGLDDHKSTSNYNKVYRVLNVPYSRAIEELDLVNTVKYLAKGIGIIDMLWPKALQKLGEENRVEEHTSLCRYIYSVLDDFTRIFKFDGVNLHLEDYLCPVMKHLGVEQVPTAKELMLILDVGTMWTQEHGDYLTVSDFSKMITEHVPPLEQWIEEITDTSKTKNKEVSSINYLNNLYESYCGLKIITASLVAVLIDIVKTEA